MPEYENKAAKRLRKWNPLKLLKDKVIPKGSYLEKTAYAKYKKQKARSPETILKTKSFSKWKKTRKEAAKPGR